MSEGVAAVLAAMTNWPLSEEEGEEDGIEAVPGMVRGRDAAGAPVSAAPITVSVVGPRLCASPAGHRRVTLSSGTMRGGMQGTGGYTTPGKEYGKLGVLHHPEQVTKPVRWVTCHVIGAWPLGEERPSFHGNKSCYHGNSHRFHGCLGLNGNHR